MIQSYIRVTYVCCLLGGSAMGQCATKHLWAAPPLEVGHWGEYFHHGNQKCDKSESPYPDPQSQLLNIYQQVTGYNTICLVVCKLQKIPKCEVHTVTLPLPAIAGQVSGLCKWILYTAESNPFSIRSFIMHFCQFLVDIFLNYITYNLLSFTQKFCQYLSISLRLECEYNHHFFFYRNDILRGHEGTYSFPWY